MRFVLAFLALLALASGPLGPSAAAAVSPEHCSSGMDGMDHGSSDKQGVAKTKSCCVMAMATIDGSTGASGMALPRIELASAALPSLVGRRGDVEIPPPRS